MVDSLEVFSCSYVCCYLQRVHYSRLRSTEAQNLNAFFLYNAVRSKESMRSEIKSDNTSRYFR